MARDRVKKRLAVDPEEAKVVELIYSWYLAGLGAKAIAQRLNEEGQLYRGKRWSKNRILDIIGDEAYAGTYFFKNVTNGPSKISPGRSGSRSRCPPSSTRLPGSEPEP